MRARRPLALAAAVTCATASVALAAASDPAPAAVAAPPAPAPTCVTLASPDGLEPPCNPHLADSTWAMGHRNSYAQASAPVAGPRPGEQVRHEYQGLGDMPVGVIVGALFSSPYPDGKRVAWALGVAGTNDNPIYKIDPDTREVIDVYTRLTDEAELPTGTSALSGIYVMVDRDNHLIQPLGRTIRVYGDSVPGDRTSPIAALHTFTLPDRALCGADDEIVGQTMLWNGKVAFVTERGMVGLVPRDITRMDDEHLLVASLNPREACETGEEEALETVSNSLAADEFGGIFPVTDHAQYRLDVRAGELDVTWRTPYQRGSGTSASRQDAGSGSTPTLMGTRPQDDKFVVITDGQDLTHLVLMWKDTIPADWAGLPGRPRRIACEFPIDFGDPSRTRSSSEQSVVVRGYSSLVPNNELRNMDLVDPLLAPLTEVGNLPIRLALAGFLGQSPLHAPHGFERIDWNPRTRTCRTVWVNKQVSIPNGVPNMSPSSRMVYGIGQRRGVWGLEGMDFRTGRPVLWVRGSAHPFENAYYSGLQTAPDGSLWSGATLGFTVYDPLR
ncbi:hypothetical protein [Nocardioides stalactiti]|uniref:hypothetical protein n=1 Tax=Nocardioides stalactiti TaxID=2755356 RepID=UPI001603722E|nr:hypothetical protein [Nocardioides stalactiti]